MIVSHLLLKLILASKFGGKSMGDISNIISEFGTDYIKSNLELRFKCPFCQSLGLKNSDYKLYVNSKSLKYNCFRCESKGIIGKSISNESNVEIYDKLPEFINLSTNRDNVDTNSEDLNYIKLPKWEILPDSPAFNYLLSRGLSQEDMSYYKMRVSGEDDDPRLFGRVIIPNRVIYGVWTDFYVARTYLNDPVRYYNPASIKSHNLVFNSHRLTFGEPIIINEGVLNSIVAGKQSVATFGKYVSDLQLKIILANNPSKLYISLDTDARNEAEKLCYKIKNIGYKGKIFLVELPDNKDALDLGKDEYFSYINSSKEYVSKFVYDLIKFVK